MHVRIFLSTVSNEFLEYRDQLRHDLTRHNVEVKVQEDFKDYGSTTLEKLDLYIIACDAVVHLVGDMTGAIAKEPSIAYVRSKYSRHFDELPPLREILANGVEISYTQWEAWLALCHNKALLVAQAEATAPRGPNYKPTDISRAAQRKHLERLRSVERYPGITFTSPDNLAKQIAYTTILDLLAKDRAIEKPSALRLTVGEAGPYFDTKSSLFGFKRTLKLKIENTDRQRAISDCRVQIRKIVPGAEHEGPWLLTAGLSLAAGDHTFVALATYGEAREPEKFNCADSFLTLGTDNGHPFLSVGTEYILTLRATAMQTSWSEIQCKLWVSGEGRLRIESIDAASQILTAGPLVDPQLEQNAFFLRAPHSNLSAAVKEASQKNKLVFVVVFDSSHPTRSKLHYALGYFLEYQTTKRLVDEYFVAVVGSNSDPDLARLVPQDDPLENCLWIVLDSSGNILRRESVYANPDEGMKRVRQVIAEYK